MESPGAVDMSFAVLFLLLAGAFSALAVRLGGAWHLLHWLSLSCLVLAVGYAGLGARCFGKRPDGTLPLWAKILHLPFLLYSHGLWLAIRALSRENATDAVAPDLVVGRRLHPAERPADLDHYVDLTAEFDEPGAIRQAPGYLNLPILDGSVPRPEALRNALARVRDGRIYVHCAQGHGRTGLFALALLAERGRISTLEEGLALLRKARPGIRLKRVQAAFLREFLGEGGTEPDAAGQADGSSGPA